MYVTRPLSLYRNNPSAVDLPPPEGPNGGFLVLQDDDSTPRHFCGLLKDRGIKDFPFPQNKLHDVTHTEGTGRHHRRADNHRVYFIPAINHPLSSNIYYAIKTKRKHKSPHSKRRRVDDSRQLFPFKSTIDGIPLSLYEPTPGAQGISRRYSTRTLLRHRCLQHNLQKMPPNTRQNNKRSRIHGVEQCQQISSSQLVEAERQTESHGHGGSLQSESSHVLRDLETNIPHVEVETSVGTKKKRVRGPTCMPKLWGLQPNNLVEVSFNYLGQPNDEKKTTTLSHFLGTIARNGRYCPLQYSDWRLIPESYKDEMKRLVKAKFDLPPGHDPFVMKSINKKWRNWKCTLKSLNFDPDVPVEEQMLEIPKGVNEDQYKKLIEHWISDKSKSVCEKNKQTRSKLEFFHRMGKKSFAIIRETMKKHLGRYPTRAELFEECYYKQDGSPMSQAVLEVIEKMKELEAQNSENSVVDDDAILVSNDVFSKVMGKDKEGQVRMYGLGVKATDVYGGKPSRAALERKNMDYEIQLKMMNDKIEELTALVHGRSCSNNEQPEVEMNHVVSPSQSNPQISSATTPNNHHTSAKTSSPLPIKVRSKVVLKKFGNMDEIVATGIVWAMSGVRANGIDLGDDFCEVSIQRVLKPDVKLFLGPEDMDTLFDALGAPIPWPISLVALADED